MEGGARLTLDIRTTTGRCFALSALASASVEQLKRLVARRLRVPKDRICLLHRERQLRDGTLEDNGLIDGSRVILLPSVETGLLTQRPENSVMQALESLNDSQVNDFLSGKSPLNLTMRLGDHMMLIQLQLSTYPGGGSSTSTSSRPRSSTTTQRASAKTSHPITKITEQPAKSPKPSKSSDDKMDEAIDLSNMPSTSSGSSKSNSEASENKIPTLADIEGADDFKSFLCKQDIETLQNAFEIFKSLAEMQEGIDKEPTDAADDSNETDPSKYVVNDESRSMEDIDFEGQSPIKSLSNLVSGPMKSLSTFPPLSIPVSDNVICSQKEDKPPPKYVPLPSSLKNNLISSIVSDPEKEVPASFEYPVITDPIAANLTSCLCSTLNPDFVCGSNCHPTKFSNESPIKIIDSEAKNDTLATNHTDVFMDSSSDNAEDTQSLLDLCTSKNLNTNGSKSSIKKNKSPLVSDKCQQTNFLVPNPVSKSAKNKRLHYLLHKTSKPGNQVIQNKPKAFMQSLVNKHIKKQMQQSTSSTSDSNNDLSSSSKSEAVPNSYIASNHFDSLEEPSTSGCRMDDIDSSQFSPSTSSANGKDESHSPISDSNSLVEASKNLTQTLKKLSKEVLTNKVDLANEETLRPKIGQGAVIESMKHHGKGIYSGTFSGTLNPALQDRFGRPKRDISTIIHILNDLLCATPPQYRRGARITFEPTHNGQPITRAKQRDFKHNSFNCSAGNGSDECECNKCNNALNLCPYGECNGHYSSPTPSDSTFSPMDICNCRRVGDAQSTEACSCATDDAAPDGAKSRDCQFCKNKNKETAEHSNKELKSCRKCHSASTLALDNSKTKCKLDQLRLVMQQKKQRREERKIKSAPYPTSVINQSDSPNVLAEEIQTLA